MTEPNRWMTVLSKVRDGVVARFDDWFNPYTGMGTTRDKTTYGRFAPNRLLTDEELSALYHSDDMAARMIDVVPQEMLREPFDVETGDADIDSALAEKFERLDLRAKLVEATRWARCYGGSAIILGAVDGLDAAEPLRIRNVEDLKFLYPVDRRLLWPLRYYDQPGHPKIGQPMTYMVTTIGGNFTQTAEIHESRLVIFRGAPTGIREKLALASWDMSYLQRAFDVLRQFNTGWKAVETLMTDGNQTIYKMSGLVQMLNAPDGMSLLQNRIQVIDMYRSFVRALVVDADANEDVSRQVAQFAGIPDVLEKFMLRLAAAVQIPVTILMGQSPAGLNATGDNDFRWFYDRIRAEQTTTLAPQIRRIANIWLHSQAGPLHGKPKVNVNVKFAPLWAETPLAQAQREAAIAQRDATYIQNDVLQPEEVALARFRPEGFANEIQLTPEGKAARESLLKIDLAKIASGQTGPQGLLGTDPTMGAPQPGAEPAPDETPEEAADVNKSLAEDPEPDDEGGDSVQVTVGSPKGEAGPAGDAEKVAEGKPTEGDKAAEGKQSGDEEDDVEKQAKAALKGTEADDGESDDEDADEEDEDEDKLDSMFFSNFDASDARMFHLNRLEDETGISGAGIVAKGIEFEDGVCVIRWRTKTPGTTVFANKDHMLEVHGHGGKTVLEYIGEEAEPKHSGKQVFKIRFDGKVVDSGLRERHTGKIHYAGVVYETSESFVRAVEAAYPDAKIDWEDPQS